MYKLLLSKRSLKKIKKLHSPVQEQVVSALKEITSDPYQFKALRYELKGYYRARIGKLRIIYRIDEKGRSVFVVVIEHRKKVYSDRD